MPKKRLKRDDFNLPCEKLAIALLGKLLVRKLPNGTKLVSRICETEAYLAQDDKASRTCGGKRTPACEPLYMTAGTCFIYMTYGMYHCFNISTKEPGSGVLLRAAEPSSGIDQMKEHRMSKWKTKKAIKEEELCSGPSKLCMSMNITRENCNKLDLTDNDLMWFEDDGKCNDFTVVKTSRIGVDSAGPEWAKKPLRFYILGNQHVSKRDLIAEKSINSGEEDGN